MYAEEGFQGEYAIKLVEEKCDDDGYISLIWSTELIDREGNKKTMKAYTGVKYKTAEDYTATQRVIESNQ